MTVDQIARDSLDVQLPRAGFVGVYAVTGSASSINLVSGSGVFTTESLGNQFSLPTQGAQSLANQPGSGGAQQSPFMNPSGFVGHYVDIFADGADVGIISGPTQASVTGGNAPNLSTTGSPGTAGTCMRIASGTFRSYYVKPDDQWLGVVGSAAGNLRIALSSR